MQEVNNIVFGCFAGFEGFDCSLLWIVILLLFFLAALFRKNIAEGILGMDFSLIGSTIFAEILFIIIILVSKSIKWSFLIALIGLLIGGFVSAPWMPDGSSEGGGGEGWY